LTIVPGPGPGEVTVSWTGGGVLQRSTNLSNPAGWTTLTGAANPLVVSPATGNAFYRIAPGQ
jgi:hypothetical protein